MTDNLSDDSLMLTASNLFIKSQVVSKNLLQRRLKIDEPTAEQIMVRLERAGIINLSHDGLTEEYKSSPVNMEDGPILIDAKKWKRKQDRIDKVRNLLKKYWWFWSIIFFLSIAIMWVGPATIGNTLYKLTTLICLSIITGYFFYYTMGKGTIGIWGFLRLFGFIGFVFFSVELAKVMHDFNLTDILWNHEYQLTKHNFLIFAGLDAVFLFFLSLGELLLYLHKINIKLNLIDNSSNN